MAGTGCRRVGIVPLVMLAALAAGAARGEPGAPAGAAVFRTRCAACHGESGRADTPPARTLKVRPLAADAQLAAMAPAALAQAIRSDPKHRGLGAVTGLDDVELRAVADFVRTLAATR